MCDICLRSPCLPRCPNAPEPATIYTCAYCGEPIIEGDEYMKFDGDYYHLEDCAQDVALTILLDKGGAERGTAEVDSGW